MDPAYREGLASSSAAGAYRPAIAATGRDEARLRSELHYVPKRGSSEWYTPDDGLTGNVADLLRMATFAHRQGCGELIWFGWCPHEGGRHGKTWPCDGSHGLMLTKKREQRALPRPWPLGRSSEATSTCGSWIGCDPREKQRRQAPASSGLPSAPTSCTPQSCLGVVPLQSLGCGIGWCGLVLPQGWTVLAGVGVGLCSLGLDRGSDVGMCWSVRVRRG